MIELLHGIQAYSGRDLLSGLRARVSTVHAMDGMAEVCCANRAIGCIGLMLTGNVTGMFEGDCWSVRNVDGSRRATRDWVYGLVCSDNLAGSRTYGVDAMDKPAGLSDVIDIIDRHVAVGSHYAEFWLRDPVITGVWVKEGQSELIGRFADWLARQYYVPCYELARGYKCDQVLRNALAAQQEQSIIDPMDLLEQDLMGF